MRPEVLVLFGDFSDDQRLVGRAAWDFGWSIRKAATLRELRQVAREAHIVAVLWNATAWVGDVKDGVRQTSSAIPGRPIVACYRFRDADQFDRDSPTGAFHTLALPFSQSEVRQSLGFLSEATARERTDRAGKQGVRRATSSAVRPPAQELAS